MINSLSSYGSIASILGTVISICILWNLRRLRKHFLLKARIPEIIKSLSIQVKELSTALQNFESQPRDIESILAICMPIIKNLSSKISGPEKRDTKTVLKKLKKRNKPLAKDEAWDLYNELQALVEALKHFQQDRKWSQ